MERPDAAEGLKPEWHRPVGGVGAWMSTRAGGVSQAPWDTLNLGTAVGDDADAVAQNRRRFAGTTGAVPVYLRQVHGVRVVRLTAAHTQADAPVEDADACVTTLPGIACTIQVADCLPALFIAPRGRAVGAAHAGWRGLAGGVLEAAARAVCEAAVCEPHELQCWLGPCIGPERFEVGADVLEACGVDPAHADPARFRPQAGGKWLANLPQLARDRLAAAGVVDVSGGRWCTVTDASRFFSYRRDGITGRMAGAVWIDRR